MGIMLRKSLETDIGFWILTRSDDVLGVALGSGTSTNTSVAQGAHIRATAAVRVRQRRCCWEDVIGVAAFSVGACST